MLPWSVESKGRFEKHRFEGEVLKGNPLVDPHVEYRYPIGLRYLAERLSP